MMEEGVADGALVGVADGALVGALVTTSPLPPLFADVVAVAASTAVSTSAGSVLGSPVTTVVSDSYLVPPKALGGAETSASVTLGAIEGAIEGTSVSS